MNSPAGPPPLLGLVAALVVLVGGIAAAFTRDESTSTRTSQGIVSSTRPSPTTSSSAPTTPPTFSTLPTTSLPPISTSTTVRPAVPTPEAAANGLWAAYTSSNQSAAARFGSPPVVELLFSTPYSGEDGTFQGCAKRDAGSIFDCQYEQPSAKYTMTAEADAAGSFKIVVIEIVSAATTTSSSGSG